MSFLVRVETVELQKNCRMTILMLTFEEQNKKQIPLCVTGYVVMCCALLGSRGQEAAVGCQMSSWTLAEFGQCLIALNAHSVFLTFSCLLGLILFPSFPEHPATSPQTCWRAGDAAHCRHLQLVKLHQAWLLPQYLGVIFFSFSFVLGLSASSADGIFIMFSESPYGL